MGLMDPYSADDIKRRKDEPFIPRGASEKKFQPLTSQFEISGTKYGIQFGRIDSEWASVLLVDNRIIRACVYKKENLSKLNFPNLYNVVGWLLITAVMPKVYPRELMKLISRMLDQLVDNRDRGIEVNYAAFYIDPYLVDDMERVKANLLNPSKSSEKDFKLSEQGFSPLSSQLGIPGTSFRIQLGHVHDKWASRLLKDNQIIDSYVYKDEELSAAGFLNQNLIVGWVLRTVAIPNINPHQIMKITQALTKQAMNMSGDKVYDLNELKKMLDGILDDSTEGIRERVLKRLRERRGDFLPYPYIFKPPEPPDDVDVATNVQLNHPVTEEELNLELFCRYCGSELSMDERFCSVCGKKS